MPTNQRPSLVTTNKVSPGATITMIPSSKVTVVPAASLSTRPILAQPSPSRPSTPILRGVTPVTLRAPNIRLASPGSVHLIATSQPAQTKVTRAGAGPGGPRVPSAVVSFRPSGPLVTTARPAVSPTGATKTIVTQNPAGVFKPITTQVASVVSGQPVALKPSSTTGSLPVRVPPGGRVTMVSSSPASHIQVPLVPGAVGPPKSRVAAIPSVGGAMKVVSGVSMVSVAPVQITQTPPARTIQLPNSGPSTTNIPVARVIPQQATRDAATGYVVAGTFVPGANQASPVNLTMTRASVPAMTIPNFNQTTLMYERDAQNSVTITTLPAGDGQHSSQSTPATITPARITPMVPGETDKTVPGSPRPSILRKRPDSEAVTPIKGTAILTSPSSPPRPDSSGSSTISATSSLPALSGDEQPPPPAPASIEPSPRKKPRKQQLPPRETNTNISPEWAAVKREIGHRDRLEWKARPEADWEGKVRNWNMESGVAEVGWDQEQDLAQDQADDEEEISTDEERDKQTGSLISGKPTVTLLNSYRHTWKSRHNHFLRYSDVKSKVRVLTVSDRNFQFLSRMNVGQPLTSLPTRSLCSRR